jgi:hypothetical protein
MEALAAGHNTAVQMIDTSVVRVHQHGACVAAPQGGLRTSPSVIARSKSDEAIQSFPWLWIASRSLSSGAHSRDPLARNDSRASGYRFDVRFFEVFRFFDVLRFLEAFFFDAFFGTLLPLARASDRPIAIACLRLFTLRPERPLFSVPALRFFIARSTLSDAFLEYFLAMDYSPGCGKIIRAVPDGSSLRLHRSRGSAFRELPNRARPLLSRHAAALDFPAAATFAPPAPARRSVYPPRSQATAGQR